MNDLQMKAEDGPIRADFDAHAHAMSLPIQDVVKELTDLLGATNVAVIGGVTETRAVQQWTTDREPQRAHVLRFALQIATMIAAVADRDLARAWFHGSNPHLDDAVPLMMLRNLPLIDIQGKLMAAARIFAARPPGGPASS
ncbi:MAG: hypothetical protein JOZ28_00420 [Candidatus Eremiobacteraeota bacterium]|nr:hypothetical protein [Candidatus Eremiobacteraeota bacterium]